MMSPVQATDTTATITPAGIEYTKNDDVSMDEEVLKLSTKSVVSYTFTIMPKVIKHWMLLFRYP